MELVVAAFTALAGLGAWYLQRRVARRGERERERRLLLAELVANAEAIDAAAPLGSIHPSDIRRGVYEGRRENLADHLSESAWARVEDAYRSMSTLPSNIDTDLDAGRNAMEVALAKVHDAIGVLGGTPPLRQDERLQQLDDEIPRLILESQRTADAATATLAEFKEHVARQSASLPPAAREFSAALRAKLEEGVTPAELSRHLRSRYGSSLSEEDLVKLDELVLAEDAVVRAQRRGRQRGVDDSE